MDSADRIDLYRGEYKNQASLSIPQTNLLAFACSDSKVRIYGHDTDGDTLREFSKNVSCLVHCDGDVMASIDSDGNLVTWNIRDATVLETAAVFDVGFLRPKLLRLSATSLAIISPKHYRIAHHTSGRDLEVGDRTAKAGKFSSIYSLNEKCFALVSHTSVLLCNDIREEAMRTIEYTDKVGRMAANDKFLVAACRKGYIHIRQNGGNYAIISSKDLRAFIPNRKTPSVSAVSFLNPNLLMVTVNCKFVLFFSMPKMELVDTLPMKKEDSVAFVAVLGDTRICVSGNKFCYIRELPPLVRIHLQRLHPSQKECIDVDVTRKRKRGVVDEVSGVAEKLDSAMEESPKKSRMEGHATRLPGLIETFNTKLEVEKQAVKRLELELEEQKRETEKQKEEIEKQKDAVKKLTRELEQERKKTAHLENTAKIYNLGMKVAKQELQLLKEN